MSRKRIFYLAVISVLILFAAIIIYSLNLNMINKKVPYVVNEKLSDYVLMKNFQSYKQKNITEQDYENLITNMDKSSIDTVNKILSNVEQITSKNKGEKLYIYANKDLNRLKSFHNSFQRVKEMRINGKLAYKFDDIIIPNDRFEPHIFIYECDINLVKDKKKLRQGNFIDAGAYIGDSSIVLAKYTDKKVYAFEPVLKNYITMQNLIKENNVKNIVPVKLALGDKSEDSLINTSSFLSNAASIKYNLTQEKLKEKIEIVKLDDFVATNNLSVSLIKSDIEGFEQELLKGAETTIKTQKPVLIISIYHSAEDFFHIKTLIESWNLGYKFKIVKTNPETILAETMLIAEVK